MTSNVCLTPLSGINADLAQCHLLQVGGTRLLLDCGWDENFSEELLKKLKDHVATLDAVLLSYPDPYRLGALPYLVGKMGLKCPVFATIPVARMGELYMYDVHLSKKGQEEFDLFTLDDIDTAFKKITRLAYNESMTVKGDGGSSLTISPLQAGHTVGGTIWKVVRDDEIILYGVDYNHRKERHLDGCSFEGIHRPHLLISDSFATDRMQIKSSVKGEQLRSTMSRTLKAGGDVLIPVDVGGRLLELSSLLEQMWNRENELDSFHLIFLCNVAKNVMELSSCIPEWMRETEIDFEFKHLKICESLKDLDGFTGPKVVLASVPDMESGFSRELFINWCGSPMNSIILTARTSLGTLTRTLIDEPQCKRVDVLVKKRVPLQGVELKGDKHKEPKIEKNKQEQTTEKGADNDEGHGNHDDECEDHDYVVTQTRKRKGSKLLWNRCPMLPFKRRKIVQNDNSGLGIDYDPKLFTKPSGIKKNVVKMNPDIRLLSHMQDKEQELPSKCVSAARSLNIMATVLFIDFEGRSDREYLKNVITQTKPLQLVLLKANGSSLESIVSHARSHMPSRGRVFVPTSNETFDCTIESQTVTVRMSDALIKSLKPKKVKDNEVAWIDAIVSMERDEMKDEDEHFLDVVPAEMVVHHDALATNNVRMSEFKEVLARYGFQAEIRGGAIVVNDELILRKDESGNLIPEGLLCEEYFTLMELIEEHFVVV